MDLVLLIARLYPYPLITCRIKKQALLLVKSGQELRMHTFICLEIVNGKASK